MNHQIVEHLTAQEKSIELIYLFGSMASNSQSEDSDVDVAILSEHKLDNLKRWELAQSLASLLNKDVDLVDLQQCSTVMRFQIVTEGKLLFDKNDQATFFDTTTISMYQHLQESREAMVQDYLEWINNESR